MISEFDTDGSGNICEDEFIRMYCSNPAFKFRASPDVKRKVLHMLEVQRNRQANFERTWCGNRCMPRD